MTDYPSIGKTTLTPDVIMTIARQAALDVEGVSRMAPIKNKKLLKGGREGVCVVVQDNMVLVDLYLVLKQDVNLRETGRKVQERVARTIVELTSLEVGDVNIHIENIDPAV